MPRNVVSLNVDVLFCVLDAISSMQLAARRALLAKIALTTKIVYEKAMNTLWAELDDLVPLVKCMPPRAGRIVSKMSGKGESEFVDVLASSLT